MTDYARTIMRQYSNSPALNGLLTSFDEWVDPAQFTADFLRNVWDITTAVGFGLDIWGRILGQSRLLFVQQTPGDNFGFDAGVPEPENWKPWNQAPWFNGDISASVSFALDDVDYRQLLLVKAAANIASCDVPSINALMRAMYGHRGRCFVSYDINVPMELVYHFEFTPTPVEQSIILSGLFPQPAGVDVTYVFS